MLHEDGVGSVVFAHKTTEGWEALLSGMIRGGWTITASWMERLQGEGIRGADLVFACIGPALEIFSRYRGVEAPDGRTVGLAEYLEKVWELATT